MDHAVIAGFSDGRPHRCQALAFAETTVSPLFSALIGAVKSLTQGGATRPSAVTTACAWITSFAGQ